MPANGDKASNCPYLQPSVSNANTDSSAADAELWRQRLALYIDLTQDRVINSYANDPPTLSTEQEKTQENPDMWNRTKSYPCHDKKTALRTAWHVSKTKSGAIQKSIHVV